MSVTFAKGFRAAGVEAGISAVDGKKDLALVVNDGPLDAMAGVFTPNRFCASTSATRAPLRAAVTAANTPVQLPPATQRSTSARTGTSPGE